MKHCCTCNRTLDVSCFGKNKCKKDGLQTQCNECRRVTNNKYYQESETRRTTIRRNATNTLTAIRKHVASAKATGCIACGEVELCVLDFHHTGDDKLDNISTLVSSKKSLSVIMTEVAKCVVLCANCHRKVHAGILDINVVDCKSVS